MKFEIRNHRLYRDGEPVEFRRSPNQSGRMTPVGVLSHSTADHLYPWDGLAWLTKKGSKVSAHVHIDRDGNPVQLVEFDRIAYHAGKSEWNGQSGCNGRFIGIELDSPGKLTKRGDKAVAWFGDTYPLSDVKYAKTPEHGAGYWMPYTDKQLETHYAILAALGAAYPTISEHLRHSDVSPVLKVDASPLLDMGLCHAALLSHKQPSPEPKKVMRVQGRLKELGYPVGNVDGSIGIKTKMSVWAFQNENDLPKTGEVDEETASKLSGQDGWEPNAMPIGSRAEKTVRELKTASRTVGTAGVQKISSDHTVLSGKVAALVAAIQATTSAISGLSVENVLFGGGMILVWIGWRNGWFARRIIGYRLEDTQTGRHVG